MINKFFNSVLACSILLGIPLSSDPYFAFKENGCGNLNLERYVKVSSDDSNVVMLDPSTATSNVIRCKSIFFTWDPYEGNYIESYHFVMDDGSIWEFGWQIYELEELNLIPDQEIEVWSFENDVFVMLTPAKDGSIKHVVFMYWRGYYLARQVLAPPGDL